MNQENSGVVGTITSFLLLLVKILIGIPMVPVMALWQGLKFFRRKVYSQGGWGREIAGAVAGIAGGVALARGHVYDGAPNVGWWVAAGFATALAIYAYVFPALYWVFLWRIVDVLKVFFKNAVEFLRLLFVDIWHAISWFFRKLVWQPICWAYNKVLYPVLRFVAVDIIWRTIRAIRRCLVKFCRVVRIAIDKTVEFAKYLYNEVLVPVCEFVWTRILKPLGRLIRFCWIRLCRAARWTWKNIVVPVSKFAWNHILVPFCRFLRQCARLLKKAFWWTVDNILVPVARFIWKQFFCRLGRFIERCWNSFVRGFHWFVEKVVCKFFDWLLDLFFRVLECIWEQVFCRIGRLIRWTWNTFIAKPLQWVWKHVLKPAVDAICRVVSKVWNFCRVAFVHTYYSNSTTAELGSHLLGLCIPTLMIVACVALVPKLAVVWTILLAVPVLFAIPLAYVWVGKVLRMTLNWTTGFALAFSSAYLIGLAASQLLVLQFAVGIGSLSGLLLFFVAYPVGFRAWERTTGGSSFELVALQLLQSLFGRIESSVWVLSALCIQVWHYLQTTVPAFLSKTWTDTWNWIQRIWHRFGG